MTLNPLRNIFEFVFLKSVKNILTKSFLPPPTNSFCLNHQQRPEMLEDFSSKSTRKKAWRWAFLNMRFISIFFLSPPQHATVERKIFLRIKMNSNIKKDENHFVVNKLYFSCSGLFLLLLTLKFQRPQRFHDLCQIVVQIHSIEKTSEAGQVNLKHMRPF